ncbi:polymeric immunoglobulin receptor-like [Chaetodon auriga]|uniref:polymeric immunoglobulin receptor-like n=1 Tax=Chaetodon auriga TaxID=39042 RepID=UPI0040328C79
MNACRVLFFCFFSAALCGGDSGLVSAKLNIYSVTKGGNGTLNCYLSLSGGRKFFCRDECEAGDILINTDGVVALRDRYSINYRNDSSGGGILSVTITHMTQSDSGRYRCGLGGGSAPDSYSDFEIRVSEALLDGNSGFVRSVAEGDSMTFGCSGTVYGKQKFFCRGECKKDEDVLIETDGNRAQSGRYSLEYKEGSKFGLYVTIREASRSDTGQYSCGYGRALSPESNRKFPIIVIIDETTASLSPSSGSFTPPSVLPETTEQFPAPSSASCPRFFWYLVVFVPLGFVLMAVVLLLIIWKTRRTPRSTRGGADGVHMKASFTPPASTCEDSIYQNIQ